MVNEWKSTLKFSIVGVWLNFLHVFTNKRDKQDVHASYESRPYLDESRYSDEPSIG
jgi:hypothetical protein